MLLGFCQFLPALRFYLFTNKSCALELQQVLLIFRQLVNCEQWFVINVCHGNLNEWRIPLALGTRLLDSISVLGVSLVAP
jgi:hypothetical protein